MDGWIDRWVEWLGSCMGSHSWYTYKHTYIHTYLIHANIGIFCIFFCQYNTDSTPSCVVLWIAAAFIDHPREKIRKKKSDPRKIRRVLVISDHSSSLLHTHPCNHHLGTSIYPSLTNTHPLDTRIPIHPSIHPLPTFLSLHQDSISSE